MVPEDYDDGESDNDTDIMEPCIRVGMYEVCMDGQASR